jgi:hypothetical protein
LKSKELTGFLIVTAAENVTDLDAFDLGDVVSFRRDFLRIAEPWALLLAVELILLTDP